MRSKVIVNSSIITTEYRFRICNSVKYINQSLFASSHLCDMKFTHYVICWISEMSTGWNTQTEDKNSHVLLASTMPGQICIKSIINTRVQINYKTCIPVCTINPKDKNWFIWFWHFACIQEFWSHIWAFDLLRAVERFMAVMCLISSVEIFGVLCPQCTHTIWWASMKCPNPQLNGHPWNVRIHG